MCTAQENRTAGVTIMKKDLIVVGEQFHYFPAFVTFFFNEDRPDWSVYYLGRSKRYHIFTEGGRNIPNHYV